MLDSFISVFQRKMQNYTLFIAHCTKYTNKQKSKDRINGLLESFVSIFQRKTKKQKTGYNKGAT